MAGVKKRVDIFINGQQAGQTIGQLYKNTRKLRNEINGLTPGTAKYNAKVKELSQANAVLDQHRQKIRGIKGGFKNLTSGIGSAIKAFGPLAAAGAIVGGIVSGVRNWVDVNLKLEKSLSSLKSLTGASAEDLRVYKEEAINIGSTTTLSATQAVDGFKLVGSARPELLKNRDALIAVTKEAVTLAEASGQELGPSTEAMIGIMNQFALANSDAARTSNVLAAGSKAGAANITDLAEATNKSGTVAAGYNVTLEQNVGLLETLAEKNLKGAEAGTKLRNVLLTMQSIEALPPEALRQLEQFGVDTSIVSDKTLPFQQRLEEMSKIAGDATAMTKVFGKENQVAASIILSSTDKVESYTKAVTGTNTAQEQAAINTNNLDGDLKGLASAWEGFMLKMDGGNSVFRRAVQWLTNIVNLLSGNGSIRDVLPDFIVGWLDAFDSVDNFNNAMMDTADLLVGWIPGVKKLTGSIREMTDASSKLSQEQKYQNEVTRRALNQGREVIKQRQEEIGDISVLIDALIDENTEDSKKVQIREKLQSDYPDYLKNINLETASTAELINVKKGLIAQILREGIERRKAEAMSELTDKIIDLELQKIGASEKRIEILDKQIKEFAYGIPLIEDVATEVYENFNDTVEGMDFSKPFRENNEALEETKSKMKGLQEELENALAAGDDQRAERAKKAIEVEQQRINNLDTIRNDMLNNALDAETKIAATASNAIEETKNKGVKAADDLSKELEKIVEKTAKLKQDALNNAAISGASSDEEKELIKLDIQLAEKYDKEIEAARRLSTQKGEIGERAAEQLATLEALKTAEAEREKAKIRSKFEQQRIDEAKKANEHLIQLELNAQIAANEMRVSRAAMALERILDFNVVERAKAWEEYKAAKQAQAEWEFQHEIDVLIQKFANEEMAESEFYLRKEQLEQDHQDRLNKIASDASKERRQEILNDANQVLEAAKTGIAIIGQFKEAELNNQMNLINETKEEAIKALDEEKRKGLITEQEYKDGRRSIDEKFDRDQAFLKQKAAQSQKNAAIAEAVINGALAATKVIATYGPPPNPLAIAGLITAGLQTAANIALMRSQPIPQFFDGGFHHVKGDKDGKTYNAKFLGRHEGGMLPGSPSLLLASEKGSEYFVPNHLLNDPLVANYVRVIEAIRTNQFAAGGFTSSPGIQSVGGDAVASPEMAGLIAQNTAVLMKLSKKMDHISARIEPSEVERITEMQNVQSRIQG